MNKQTVTWLVVAGVVVVIALWGANTSKEQMQIEQRAAGQQVTTPTFWDSFKDFVNRLLFKGFLFK